MRVLVFGSGAVGLLYGGWLLAAGGDVSFLARGETREALATRGLTLHAPAGTLHFDDVQVHGDTLGNAGPFDVILLTVKSYDLEAAARACLNHLVPDGVMIGLQNGVDGFDRLSRIVDRSQIMVGPVYSAVRTIGRGEVEATSPSNLVAIGNPDLPPHPHAAALLALWRAAGVDAALAEDIRSVLWVKFAGFATNAALTCLARLDAGTLFHDPDLLDLARRSIAEVTAVGRAEGAVMPDRVMDDTLGILRAFAPSTVASMRHDLDVGRRLELDSVSGAIRAYGRKHGIATPFHDIAYACLKPFREGRPRPVA